MHRVGSSLINERLFVLLVLNEAFTQRDNRSYHLAQNTLKNVKVESDMYKIMRASAGERERQRECKDRIKTECRALALFSQCYSLCKRDTFAHAKSHVSH